MGQISDIRNPWRQILLSQPASFRSVQFHVESGSRAAGRRTVVHEYPKRNEPYAEDMGVHARRFTFSGYLIYRWGNPPPGMAPYTVQRTRLVKALEDDDIARLVHPVICPEGMQVMCERYSMTESRERGGYTQFDMQFVQSGSPGNSMVVPDTSGIVTSRAGSAEQTAANALIAVTRELNRTSLTQAVDFTPNTAERLVMEALDALQREISRQASRQ